MSDKPSGKRMKPIDCCNDCEETLTDRPRDDCPLRKRERWEKWVSLYGMKPGGIHDNCPLPRAPDKPSVDVAEAVKEMLEAVDYWDEHRSASGTIRRDIERIFLSLVAKPDKADVVKVLEGIKEKAQRQLDHHAIQQEEDFGAAQTLSGCGGCEGCQLASEILTAIAQAKEAPCSDD